MPGLLDGWHGYAYWYLATRKISFSLFSPGANDLLLRITISQGVIATDW
jgi:hypothetical protein